MPEPLRRESGKGSTEIRPIATLDEFQQCVELQRDTWGRDFGEVVPPALMQVTQKLGGIVAGAFDHSSDLVGFLYGITGTKDGRLAHWSHMLAVRHDWGGQGVGRMLKEYQRLCLLEAGVGVAYWTFDPLVARNAHLNLNRLGASISEYVPMMYGETRSELHSGLGTDRFLVRWDLQSDRVVKALELGSPPHGPVPPDTPTIGFDSRGAESYRPGSYPKAATVGIAVPRDIQSVKTGSNDMGWRWRKLTREAFLWYLARGYEVRAFESDPSGETCRYLLSTEKPEPVE